MSIEVIEQRLSNYNCKDRTEEINALKEITQEVALMSLSRADFFKEAELHGDTALRILYNIQRYSEDYMLHRLKEPRTYFVLVGIFGDSVNPKLGSEIFIDNKPEYYDFNSDCLKLTEAQVFAMYAPKN